MNCRSLYIYYLMCTREALLRFLKWLQYDMLTWRLLICSKQWYLMTCQLHQATEVQLLSASLFQNFLNYMTTCATLCSFADNIMGFFICMIKLTCNSLENFFTD